MEQNHSYETRSCSTALKESKHLPSEKMACLWIVNEPSVYSRSMGFLMGIKIEEIKGVVQKSLGLLITLKYSGDFVHSNYCATNSDFWTCALNFLANENVMRIVIGEECTCMSFIFDNHTRNCTRHPLEQLYIF